MAAGVRLGGRLQLSRAADLGVAGAQPDGLQHVASAGRCSTRSAASTPAWVARPTARWAARRPSSASGRRPAFREGRFLLEPRAVVHHAVPAERASWSYFRARCRAEGISKARVAAERRPDGRAVDRERLRPAGAARRCAAQPRSGSSRRPGRAGRAGAIVAGLAFTATGFLTVRWTRPAGARRRVGSTLRSSRARRRCGAGAAPGHRPERAASAPIDARRAGRPPYGSALCLVTRDGDPLDQGAARPARGASLAGDQVDAQLPSGAGAGRHESTAPRRSRPAARRGGPSGDRGGGDPGPPRPAGRVPALDLRRAACSRTGSSWWTTPRRATRPPSWWRRLARDRAAAVLRPRGPAGAGPGPQRGAAARAHRAGGLHRRRRGGRPALAGTAGRRVRRATTGSAASPG